MKHNYKIMLKHLFLHIGVFAASIAALWGILILTSLIPNEKIYLNMLKSAESYSGADAFSFENGKKYNAVSDNYADVILLNILWNIDSTDPVRSSLDTKYYNGEEYGENFGFYAAVTGKEPNTDYTRYWHGSVVFIRPIMLFTDVKGIKLIGFVSIIILAAAVCVLLVKLGHRFAAAEFAFSLLCVHIYNIRLSLEYIPIFIVSLLMCILFILYEKRGNEPLTVLSVISGTAAAFFDFLTAETLSILLPLILVMIIRESENRLDNIRKNVIFVLKCGIYWGASYIGTFAIKWVLASAVSGENKFTAALSSAEIRFSGDTDNLSYAKQIFLAPLANISTLFGGESRVDAKNAAIGTILAVTAAAVVYLIFRRKRVNLPITVICLILGLVPYLRFAVLSNHSYLHEFFTYRAQAASILALCSAVWFNTELYEPKAKKRGKRK